MKLNNNFLIEKGVDGGFYIVPKNSAPCGMELRIIASTGINWDHVSVSLKNRVPNWQEMCFVKELFFEDSDCVIQYHPPKKDYVNIHNNVLHLWRPQNFQIPTPPLELI